VQKDADSPSVFVTKKTGYPISSESLVIFRTAGGGGWGDPLEREPEHVANDVRAGYISEESASDFGVVLDPMTNQVDVMATEELRTRLRGERNSF
jgi:N-methylhydantoinase B